ncbi:MAG: hypothetical protein HY619_05070 [Thaumarchaeota archaeon]|nr:hypothetical protein [Nitrososphaerota archaeon]
MGAARRHYHESFGSPGTKVLAMKPSAHPLSRFLQGPGMGEWEKERLESAAQAGGGIGGEEYED